MSATSAADRLASPREHGTLRLAYRRSAMALQNVFDWLKPQEPQGERESLLQSENREGNSSAQYGSTLQVPADQRVPRPKPVKSPVRVEAKVWFANERTWISWLRVSLLIGAFSLAMYNSASFFSTHPRNPIPPGQEPGPEVPWTSPSPKTIRSFAIVYALISVLVLGWGLFNYHRRLYLIRTKYAGDFDDLIGPPVICIALFVAVLLNFVNRVQEHALENGG